MGCVASKLEEEQEVVSICRERKRLLKLAVERRYALAEAHCRYCQSLYAVAAAIKLFVARHSSPTSPFLITFPPPPPPTEQNVITNPMFLEQGPSESTTHEAIACESGGSTTSSDSSEEEETKEEERERSKFLGKAELEESGSDDVKVVDGVANGSQCEQKGLTVIDTPERGRELLEALKDIEDHFVRAYDSGKDVSRMLEANRVYLQSGLEEIKENSTKLIQAITWHRSASSSKPSCKSLVASSSKSPSTWTEYKNDLFDEYGGMDSGSHSLTLGRLYAWEKKLYEEIKSGDSTWKIYERKCSRLRNQDVRGDDELAMDKTRAAVKDLYAGILVAIRSAESISKRIEKLRDEELQPQIVELLKGLTHTWKIMLESHETQNKILFEVKSFACTAYGKFCNDSHRLATLQLEAEIHNWCACFTEYVAAQKAYVEALHGWLTKFLVPEVEFYSRRSRSSAAPYRPTGPPLLVICHNWLSSMENLPSGSVSFALRSFSKDVRALWTQQGEEQQQKRKVDNLAKQLDRRTLAMQKTETRFLESKLIEFKTDQESEHHNQLLTEKKDQLDIFRKKLDMEKEKHHKCMQETQRITLSGFQTGFSTVFKSITEFSKASMKMYNDLVNCSESAGKLDNQSYIEGAQFEKIDI
ncbi:hypothetical protein GH714_032885 [Hevea brasiliensis]|uniref:DUF632 domain-containing protein n=1 Tax=Hevea brasiliensis TaxID=3981 RepID=A0A6A6LR73_HEVBR|nr:hypothetical protein GH714_032885 [Hevea brasiliensis]